MWQQSFTMCFPQGRALLSRLQGLKAKGIQLKISSGMIDSTELRTLARHSQLSLSLYYKFCVSVFKHAAAKLCLFSLLTVLSPYLCCSVLSISHSLSIFPFICLCVSCSCCSCFCLWPDLSLSFSLSHMRFLYFCLSFSCWFLCFTQSLFLFLSLSFSISRCWGPLCEHDSADPRPPPLLLLGGRQETFLHRQRQHGLEISGHSIYNPLRITAHTETHIHM